MGHAQLPWSNMAKVLSDFGVCLHNWPEGVEFPGQSKSKQGIKALPTRPTNILLTALRGDAGESRKPYIADVADNHRMFSYLLSSIL